MTREDRRQHRLDERRPQGFTAGQINTRDYCGNSPTNGTDPTGLWLCYHTQVHEYITYQAAKAAGYKQVSPYLPPGLGDIYYSKGKGTDNSFGLGLERGVEWVDVPEGLSGLSAITDWSFNLDPAKSRRCGRRTNSSQPL